MANGWNMLSDDGRSLATWEAGHNIAVAGKPSRRPVPLAKKALPVTYLHALAESKGVKVD